MTRKSDSESIIAKIQNQMEKKDLDRRFIKDLKRPAKPAKTYTTSFLNSQLRNKSFDHAKSENF